MTYSSHSDDGRPTDGLMFTVSRFTVQKEDRNWPSPRPIDCALYFTFRHGHQGSFQLSHASRGTLTYRIQRPSRHCSLCGNDMNPFLVWRGLLPSFLRRG